MVAREGKGRECGGQPYDNDGRPGELGEEKDSRGVPSGVGGDDEWEFGTKEGSDTRLDRGIADEVLHQKRWM